MCSVRSRVDTCGRLRSRLPSEGLSLSYTEILFPLVRVAIGAQLGRNLGWPLRRGEAKSPLEAATDTRMGR